MTETIAEHDAAQSHKYVMHFPEHVPREQDPHYKAFEAFKRKTESTASWGGRGTYRSACRLGSCTICKKSNKIIERLTRSKLFNLQFHRILLAGPNSYLHRFWLFV